jgi:hypothetical protein
MRTKIIWRLLLPALALGACEEVVVNKYDGDTSLYFFRGNFDIFGNRQQDSLNYSFYLKESARERDTLWIEVRLTGTPATVARPLPLAQRSSGAHDAVPDQHYVALDDSEVAPLLVLPAGEVKVKIPVIALRDSTLKRESRVLLLELGTSEHFGPGIEGQTRFLVRLSDVASPPANWESVWRLAFGTWGAVKMRFIIDQVGFSSFELNLDQVTGDMRDYLQMKARQKLAEYEAANGPLYEDDEAHTRVRF